MLAQGWRRAAGAGASFSCGRPVQPVRRLFDNLLAAPERAVRETIEGLPRVLDVLRVRTIFTR